MDNSDNNKRKNNDVKPKFNLKWVYFVVAVALVAIYFFNGRDNVSNQTFSYTKFQECLDSGFVEEILINKDKTTLVFSISDKGRKFFADSLHKGKELERTSRVEFGSIDNLEQYIQAKKEEGRFSGSVNYEHDDGFWNIVISFGPIIFIVFLWILFMNKMGGGGVGGGIFGFGKSIAKLIDNNDKNAPKVLFKDVAGQAEAKREVHEIVDFLKNPAKYTELGGKIPKGALLVGPPGTGKTLLAKAVAGEAGVPFFSMSGSDFVEMFVGVGASRVRDLFQQAKQKAPCIVFIDEIDTIGRARGKNLSMGSNDEREGTLNQLLAEMDGFGSNSGVIVLAATNRSEILDKALLRAGRFDRQIHVDLPDLNERKEIFHVHLQPIKIDETVDVDLLARQTPGFSGADIANVCNEAALIAARHNSSWVSKQYFLDAIDRIIGGLEKKTKIMTQAEKRAIALHEAGHATVSWFCQYANPLVKVTIVPRGQALGAAWYMPEERQITTKEQILDEICATLGGRAAEDLCLGKISTGAMNDLETTTKRALGMVLYAGMGDSIPNLCYYNNSEYEMTKPYSEHTAELIDEEIKNLIDEQYRRAKHILEQHKDGHAQLAQLLIEREVIFAEDVERIFGKRPWVSRTEEILAANETASKEDVDKDSSDHSSENAKIIRQKIIDAVVLKAKNGESATSFRHLDDDDKEDEQPEAVEKEQPVEPQKPEYQTNRVEPVQPVQQTEQPQSPAEQPQKVEEAPFVVTSRPMTQEKPKEQQPAPELPLDGFKIKTTSRLGGSSFTMKREEENNNASTQKQEVAAPQEETKNAADIETENVEEKSVEQVIVQEEKVEEVKAETPVQESLFDLEADNAENKIVESDSSQEMQEETPVNVENVVFEVEMADGEKEPQQDETTEIENVETESIASENEENNIAEDEIVAEKTAAEETMAEETAIEGNVIDNETSEEKVSEGFAIGEREEIPAEETNAEENEIQSLEGEDKESEKEEGEEVEPAPHFYNPADIKFEVEVATGDDYDQEPKEEESNDDDDSEFPFDMPSANDEIEFAFDNIPNNTQNDNQTTEKEEKIVDAPEKTEERQHKEHKEKRNNDSDSPSLFGW